MKEHEVTIRRAVENANATVENLVIKKDQAILEIQENDATRINQIAEDLAGEGLDSWILSNSVLGIWPMEE